MTEAFVTVFRGDIAGAAQTIADVTWTTVLFDIEENDGDNIDMYDAATGKFTSPISGWYCIESQIRWASAGGAKSVRIIKNGDVNFPIFIRSDGAVLINTIKTRCKISKDETVEIQVFQGSGGALDIEATSDPGGLGQAAKATNALLTLVKTFGSVGGLF